MLFPLQCNPKSSGFPQLPQQSLEIPTNTSIKNEFRHRVRTHRANYGVHKHILSKESNNVKEFKTTAKPSF